MMHKIKIQNTQLTFIQKGMVLQDGAPQSIYKNDAQNRNKKTPDRFTYEKG